MIKLLNKLLLNTKLGLAAVRLAQLVSVLIKAAAAAAAATGAVDGGGLVRLVHEDEEHGRAEHQEVADDNETIDEQHIRSIEPVLGQHRRSTLRVAVAAAKAIDRVERQLERLLQERDVRQHARVITKLVERH